MSPETIELIQKGGVLVVLMLVIGWLLADRNRLLSSIKSKDEMLALKDDKLSALAERTITAIVEFRGLLQSVVDIFNARKR